jgi:hypothetical protein
MFSERGDRKDLETRDQVLSSITALLAREDLKPFSDIYEELCSE